MLMKRDIIIQTLLAGVIAELPYRKEMETHLIIFYGYHGKRCRSWARTHDGGGKVGQDGGHSPAYSLT